MHCFAAGFPRPSVSKMHYLSIEFPLRRRRAISNMYTWFGLILALLLLYSPQSSPRDITLNFMRGYQPGSSPVFTQNARWGINVADVAGCRENTLKIGPCSPRSRVPDQDPFARHRWRNLTSVAIEIFMQVRDEVLLSCIESSRNHTCLWACTSRTRRHDNWKASEKAALRTNIR